MFTKESIQEQRPYIKVSVGRHTLAGSISGFKEAYASVAFDVPIQGGGVLNVKMEWSWPSVINALNNNTELLTCAEY